jgi:hypothetical protein
MTDPNPAKLAKTADQSGSGRQDQPGRQDTPSSATRQGTVEGNLWKLPVTLNDNRGRSANCFLHIPLENNGVKVGGQATLYRRTVVGNPEQVDAGPVTAVPNTSG